MAEQVSRQAARLAASSAGYKQRAADCGKVSMVTITSPATVTWAQNDTLGSGVRLPIGTRILLNGYVSTADMGTSITLDVGLRAYKPDYSGTVIDADGIAAAVDVATAAARAVLNNGALIKDGAEFVCTVDSEIYMTLAGGTPTANAQIRIEVPVIFPG